MIQFQDLNVGDVFNTKSGRWVKVSDTVAMSIIANGLYELGDFRNISPSTQDIVVLYSESDKYHEMLEEKAKRFSLLPL